VWRGPGNWDSSDKEWKDEFWGPNENCRVKTDAQVDTRGMFKNAFILEDKTRDTEDRVREEVAEAFMAADAVHDECSMGPMHRIDEDVEASANEAGQTEPVEPAWKDP